MKDYFKVIYKKTAKEYYIQLSKYLDNNIRKFVITANPETITIAKENKTIHEALLNKDNDVIPDGIAIVKAAKHYNIKMKERITGFDTAVKLLELCNQKNKTLYLFGTKKEILEKVIVKIKMDYPRIRVVGYSDGYVEDKDQVFKQIVKLEPDLCLVALGIPKQEELISKYITKVNKGIYVGVGGTFDVLSGTKKRAPKLFIKLNLEWLYRIVTEPNRLKRFYNNNIKFMFKVYKDKK